jgi:16S rRNA processing protein RimM
MDFVKIGKIGSTHGLKGELKLLVEDAYWDDFEQVKVIFLEQKGSKMPYFIEGIRGEHQNIIKLEEVDDKDTAALVANKDLYVRAEDLSIEPDELPDDRGLRFAFLTGYTVVDSELGPIGPILSIEEYPHQEMAIVQYGEREVLIPLVPQLIQRKDKKERKLYLDLPEGLLEL